MDKSKELYSKMQELHKKYGVSIPPNAFTKDVFKLLSDFKECQVKIDWLDSELIWAAANLDRYNDYHAND